MTNNSLLNITRWRDELIFFGYTFLITSLMQLSGYRFMQWGMERMVIIFLMIGQFYLTSLLSFPINKPIFRKIAHLAFHFLNFFIFREVLMALTPAYILSDKWYDGQLVIFFLLALLGRDIKLYATLRKQLSNLERWSQKKVLFEKPEKLTIHLGEPGIQVIHPNEIVYIRTKAAGDHTKIFGIKSAVNQSFKEYESTHYANFEEISDLLRPFSQFKRISQGVILNFTYPYTEKSGTMIIEGRRFATSKTYFKT